MPIPNEQNVFNELCSSGYAKGHGIAVLRRPLGYKWCKQISLTKGRRIFTKQNPSSAKLSAHPEIERSNKKMLWNANLRLGMGAK